MPLSRSSLSGGLAKGAAIGSNDAESCDELVGREKAGSRTMMGCAMRRGLCDAMLEET